MASGTLCEIEVAAALVRHDLLVARPLDPDGAYDLLVDLDDGRFVRVQCKSGRVVKGAVVFNAHGTDHGRGVGSYLGRADVFAVYCQQVDEVFVVPVLPTHRRMMSLRLVPTRNNQASGIRWAADHTVDRWVASLGSAEREVAA